MQGSLMWDIDTSERIKNLTWWWWWWLLFINDPSNPRRTRQLMILWSTKDCDLIKVNDIWWRRGREIEERPIGDSPIDESAREEAPGGGAVRGGESVGDGGTERLRSCGSEGESWAGGKETRFDGMTASWFYDGKNMHDPFILEKNDFVVRRDASGERGELIPSSENIMTFRGGPEEYRLDIKKGAWEMHFKMTPWSAFMSKPRYKTAHYIGKYGYNILRIYGSKLSGTIDREGEREEITGSAYFQKVMVNAPATPWYWGTFHIEDGSYIDYFNPHIGLPMGRKTEAPRSWRDRGEISLSEHAQFYSASEDRVYEMQKLRIRKSWTENGLPVFRVSARSKDRGAELELVLESYARAYWRFEQKYLRWFTSILYYNEYPVEVRELVFKAGGRRITLDDVGMITGNCEHTWGKLL
ncbi:MAG: hypothetical protein QXH42_07835 [Thermoplasmata archaeon]